MGANIEAFKVLHADLDKRGVTLVAVSKIQPLDAIKQLYDLGQRDFGENYVQEMLDKQAQLPADIRWHFIGHLQRNKVKHLVPFVHLIQGVDSLKLLQEISRQGKKTGRNINCLLQVHIASEETKFGLNAEELGEIFELLQKEDSSLSNIIIQGLMGMASFSDDHEKVKAEMLFLKQLFDQYKGVATANCRMAILSMGMSGDYSIAIEAGSNMVRVGSLLFGARLKK